MESNSSRFSTGSSGMTLRSVCNGTCTSQQLTSASVKNLGRSWKSSSGRHSLIHCDNHHHHQLQNTESPRGADAKVRASFDEALNSPTLNARLTRSAATKDRLASSESRTAVSHRTDIVAGPISSPESHRLPVSGTLSTVTKVIRSVVRSSTVDRQTRLKTTSLSAESRRHLQGDYSSADELDLDERPKTDYTYAHSYLYSSRATPDEPCPSPNMSRPCLRRSGGSDSSPGLHHTPMDGLHTSSGYHTAATINTENVRLLHSQTADWRSNSNSRIRNGILVATNSKGQQCTPAWYMNSMFGLDSDSEVEISETQKQVVITTTHDSRVSSICRLLINRIGFLTTPVSYLWLVLWSSIYWVIASVLLFDTKTLVRIRRLIFAGSPIRRFLFLLLFLIPFLLAGYHLLSSNANQTFVSVVSNVTASVFSYFHIFSFSLTRPSKVIVEKGVPVENGWLNGDSFNGAVRQIILQIYGHPEGKDAVLDEMKLQHLIREIVQQELLSLDVRPRIDPQHTDQHKESPENVEFFKLKEQIEAIAHQAVSLKEEFKHVKIELDGWQQKSHTSGKDDLRFSKLQSLMLGLEEKVLHLEKNHGVLLSEMRNCCRNHSDYAAFVEEHVVITLNKIPDLLEPGSCDRFENFQNWLKSDFVTKEEMNQNIGKISAEFGSLMTEDGNSRLVQAVDEAAAESVEKYVKQHSAKIESEQVNVALQSPITENTIRALIRQHLALYDADKTGLPDYALESSGGSVVNTRCSVTHQTRTAQWSILGIPLWYMTNSPRTVIQPGVHPGECWAIKGSQGFIVIQLSGLVKISSFSLEHIPKSVSPGGTIDSAPKEFSVWGLQKMEDSGVHLGDYVYEDDGEPLQHFVVKDLEIRTFPMVELRIHSNHGSLEYTCLYRFRVHGELIHLQKSAEWTGSVQSESYTVG